MEQVEPGYHDTEYAEILPLIIIDAKKRPKWFKIAYKESRIGKIRGTPTFIIWNEETGMEIDRIVGYSGKKWFYEYIDSWIENNKKYYGQ